MFTRSLVILAVSAAVVVQAGEQKKVDLSARAKELVEKQVQEWKGNGFHLEVIEDKFVRETFRNHTFVVVRFPLWPVARIPAEPLKAQNLFVVSDDRKVTHLPDAKKLEDFFKTTLKTQLNQDKTTRTWLRLRMEYVQDGFYKFDFPKEAKVTGPGSSLTLVTGIVEVVPEGGNKGSFKAVVRFGRADDFTGVTEENMVVRGMRPRVLGD